MTTIQGSGVFEKLVRALEGVPVAGGKIQTTREMHHEGSHVNASIIYDLAESFFSLVVPTTNSELTFQFRGPNEVFLLGEGGSVRVNGFDPDSIGVCYVA